MTTDALVAAVVASLLSGTITGVGAIVAVKLSVVRLQTQMEVTVQRFDRIEKQLGITDGNGGTFTRRTECTAVERGVSDKLAQIQTELHEFRLEVDGRITRLEERA